MSAHIYEAYRVSADNSLQTLGRVAIEAGKLAIVSLLRETDRALVQKSLDQFNNLTFLVDLAPPAASSTERYGLGAQQIERGAPGFDEALIRKLESGRQIRLEAVT